MTTSIIIGSAYFGIGVLGIAGNILTAFLLMDDASLENPTYYFMIQLCACDVFVLISITIYTGLALLCPRLQHELAYKIVAYEIAVAYYSAASFMALMTISRCVQLVWPEKIKRHFSKHRIILYSIIAYLMPLSSHSIIFYVEPLFFTFFPSDFTWKYIEYPIAQIAALCNLVFNICCISTIAIFNMRSLYWVHNTRTQIHAVDASANRQREVKLFLQCAITGATFAVSTIIFFIVQLTPSSDAVVQGIVSHSLWIMLHIESPIIYFIVNGKLRQRFISVFAPCCRTDLIVSLERRPVGGL